MRDGPAAGFFEMTADRQSLVQVTVPCRIVREDFCAGRLCVEFDGCRLEITDPAAALSVANRMTEAKAKSCGRTAVRLLFPSRDHRISVADDGRRKKRQVRRTA